MELSNLTKNNKYKQQHFNDLNEKNILIQSKINNLNTINYIINYINNNYETIKIQKINKFLNNPYIEYYSN